MVNPQKEDGYTPIAHAILEAMSLASFSAREYKALLVVVRETYGWNRKDAELSLTEFAEKTNVGRVYMCRVLNGLVSKRVLLKWTQKGKPSRYRLNKHYDQWTIAVVTEGSTSHDNSTVVTEGSTSEGSTSEGSTSHDNELLSPTTTVGGDTLHERHERHVLLDRYRDLFLLGGQTKPQDLGDFIALENNSDYDEAMALTIMKAWHKESYPKWREQNGNRPLPVRYLIPIIESHLKDGTLPGTTKKGDGSYGKSKPVHKLNL